MHIPRVFVPPSARPILLAGLVAFVGGCAAIGSAWEYVTTERPPYPLRAIELTSDVWIDSAGVLLGTVVGSGSDERVTLLSSDTGFIAELVRRYRPELDRGGRDIWSGLARMGVVSVPVEGMRARRPGAELGSARVASPYGHSNVELEALRLRGSSCGWRGARAEIVVSGPLRGSRAPSLRGPVVGSFRPGTSNDARDWRDPPPRPDLVLEDALIARTERDMDSILNVRLPRGSTPLTTPDRRRLQQDPLEDVDAVEVVPLWAGEGRVRYAVALRVRRTTSQGDELLASTVMIWDAEGLWRQGVMTPAVVEFRRGVLRPYGPAESFPLYWRRLDAISGFGLDRDYLFLEQVDVAAQSVYWAAIEGRSNNVVSAVEVGGACSDDGDRGRGRDR
jgi:hypothetical protein